MSQQERCPTCKGVIGLCVRCGKLSDKHHGQWCFPSEQNTMTYTPCRDPWHDSAPSSVAEQPQPKHHLQCAIYGCEGWNGPRFCDCGADPSMSREKVFGEQPSREQATGTQDEREILWQLQYIADSPAQEHEGFHPNAVQAAKDAIALLDAERKRVQELEGALLEAKQIAYTAITEDGFDAEQACDQIGKLAESLLSKE